MYIHAPILIPTQTYIYIYTYIHAYVQCIAAENPLSKNMSGMGR